MNVNGRSDAENFRFGLRVEPNDLNNARLPFGDRAGLVHCQRPEIANGFQVRAALDENSPSRHDCESRNDGNRCRNDKRARTRNDQQHERAIGPRRPACAKEQRRNHKDQQRQRHDRGCVGAKTSTIAAKALVACASTK